MNKEEQLGLQTEVPIGDKENTERPKVKFLLIDDQPGIVGGSNICFRDYPGFLAVECHTVEEALGAVEKHQPGFLFLDHNLTSTMGGGGGEGFEIAQQVRDKFPDMKIISTTTDHFVLKAYPEKIGIEHIDKSDISALEGFISKNSKN